MQQPPVVESVAVARANVALLDARRPMTPARHQPSRPNTAPESSIVRCGSVTWLVTLPFLT
jgi:hypothetical protein